MLESKRLHTDRVFRQLARTVTVKEDGSRQHFLNADRMDLYRVGPLFGVRWTGLHFQPDFKSHLDTRVLCSIHKCCIRLCFSSKLFS